MKPIFHHRLVTGPFDDPAVFIRILREKKALLFDAGDVSGLSTRDLNKVTDVFVTHMHIDHFIGFDTIIRVLLRRDTPVTFYGPEGIIDRIQGKLRGYTWNLITEYPLVIHAIEIGKENVHQATFRAGDRFELTGEGTRDNTGSVLENPLFSVSAVNLEHGLPSLGFSIKEKIHINIDKAKLIDAGFEVGPWLNVLKDSIRNGNLNEAIDTGKGVYTVSDLDDIYVISEGQKISYIMDSSPTEDNIERIVDFVSDADSLYIEAYFIHDDLDDALKRNHLTARLSGLIAKKARVKNLHLLHFSPRYSDRAEGIINEAYEMFGKNKP